MRKREYFISLMLALLLLSGLAVLTQASDGEVRTAVSCRAGHASAAVVLKGMNLYPRCPAGKRG